MIRIALLAALAIAAVAAPPAGAAYTASLTGTTATFTGDDGSSDVLVIDRDGGQLRHNAAGFFSAKDFDSAAPGEQPLADTAAAHVIVNARGGFDLIQLGYAGVAFQAAFTVDGGDGTDFLYAPDGTSGPDTVTLGGGSINGLASGPLAYTAVEQVIVRAGGGADRFEVDAPTATQTVISGEEGDDTLMLADGASLAAAGTFQGGPGTDTLDYGEWTTPVAVDLGRTARFRATLAGGQETPPVVTSAGGDGAVEFTDLATNTFDYELYVDGLTSAEITDSHIHSGAPGVAGPVIFGIGPGSTWSNPADPSTRVQSQTDPDITEPLLRGGDTYFNVHTAANPGGEIRGQLTLDPEQGYGGTATGVAFARTVENVIGGAGDDTLRGSVVANLLDGRGGADTLDCGEGEDSEISDLTDTVTACEAMVGAATITGLDPASPADDLTPKVKGTSSPAGTDVRIFANAACSGSPVATGSAAEFAGAGIPVTVADGSLTTFYAAAADTVNQSSCSATSATYQEIATVVPTATATASPPPATRPTGAVSAIAAKATGRGKRITLDTGATAACPAGATGPCILSATATAKVRRAGKQRTTTLGELSRTLAAGKLARIRFKLSSKLSKAWRKAGRLAISMEIGIAVPGGDPAGRVATVTLKATKRKRG